MMSRDWPEPVFEHGVQVSGVTTVLRSARELYDAWREVSDLPRFIDPLESVVKVDDRRSVWTTSGPGGRTVSWEAEVVEDRPGERIAWRSVADSDTKTAGAVWFTELEHGRGTRVDVLVEYVPPFGAAGVAVSKATGDDAKTQVRRALHRFRQVMETGEAAVRRGQAVGNDREDGAGGDEVRQTDPDVRDIADGRADEVGLETADVQVVGRNPGHAGARDAARVTEGRGL